MAIFYLFWPWTNSVFNTLLLIYSGLIKNVHFSNTIDREWKIWKILDCNQETMNSKIPWIAYRSKERNIRWNLGVIKGFNTLKVLDQSLQSPENRWMIWKTLKIFMPNIVQSNLTTHFIVNFNGLKSHWMSNSLFKKYAKFYNILDIWLFRKEWIILMWEVVDLFPSLLTFVTIKHMELMWQKRQHGFLQILHLMLKKQPT